MISSDILRGYNDTIILGLLIREDSYGYNLMQAIADKSGGSYRMKETTLYSVLTRLEKNGLILSYAGSETMGRKRTYYRITPEGKTYYREKCIEWAETKQLIDRFTDLSGQDPRPALLPEGEQPIEIDLTIENKTAEGRKL